MISLKPRSEALQRQRRAKLSKLRSLFIHKLGGYVDLDDAMRGLKREDREYILTNAVARLFNTVGPDDVLSFTNGFAQFKGKKLQEEEFKLIQEEAKAFYKTTLWNVLENDIKFEANKRMFLQSQDVVDITAGKLFLFTLKIISGRLKKLATD